jgi:two-component system, OmpR family, sensor kinase
LRAEFEVTLRRPRTAEEYAETLRSCLEEVERLQRLTDELLRLARIDAREEPELAEAIPVGEIVQAALDVVRPEPRAGASLSR